MSEVRNLHVLGDYLYAVKGNLLISVDKDYSTSVKNATNLIHSETTPVTAANNGTEIVICDGAAYAWVYNTDNGSFTRIDADSHNFWGGGSVTAQDGYIISHRPNTDEFYHSALNNALSWDPLDTQKASVKPGNIVRVYSDHRELWVFKERSIEVFYNSGDTDMVWKRISGGNIELGLQAKNSVASVDNSIIWLANDGTVRRAFGFTPQIISSPQIAYQIGKLSTTSDAIGFGYMDEGHAFYELTFPTDHETFVFDISTNKWHKRASYRIGGFDGRHRANCYAHFNNKNLVGDYENGRIYEIDGETYTDNGERIIRKRTTQSLNNERNMLFMHSFQIEFEPGVGLSTGQGSDPEVMLRISRDGGKTYSNEQTAKIGRIGEYDKRAIWRRLGRARDVAFEISISDPVKIVIIGAHLKATKGIS